MIGYVTLGTNKYDEAAAFYDALLGDIGASRVMEADSHRRFLLSSRKMEMRQRWETASWLQLPWTQLIKSMHSTPKHWNWAAATKARPGRAAMEGSMPVIFATSTATS